jgi:CheY-like chemotaxis protein
VEISAPGQDGDKRLELRVVDTGVGIPADKLSAVFEKFVQADSANSRRFAGAGLGLAICRDLVELMGGTVSVESAPGAGSTFLAVLPLAWVGPGRPAPAPAPEPEPVDLSRLQVLVAEDNPTNRLVIKAVLEGLGIDPVVVEDGRQAVEAWRAGAYAVVLMDIQMPQMDGIAATRQIRALEAVRGGHTPIVALTANAMHHQVADYLASGFDDHLAKPMEIAALVKVLQAWGAGHGGRGTDAASLARSSLTRAIRGRPAA